MRLLKAKTVDLIILRELVTFCFRALVLFSVPMSREHFTQFYWAHKVLPGTSVQTIPNLDFN